MKIILPIISLLISFSIHSQEFLVLEATSQKWSGGRKESGKGTNYHIKILAKKSSEKLSIEKLWIGDQYFDVKPITVGKTKNLHAFVKKDTLSVSASERSFYITEPQLNQENEQIVKPDKQTEKPPFAYKGEGLIGYKYKGKWKYKSVEVFKKLEKANYP